MMVFCCAQGTKDEQTKRIEKDLKKEKEVLRRQVHMLTSFLNKRRF